MSTDEQELENKLNEMFDDSFDPKEEAVEDKGAEDLAKHLGLELIDDESAKEILEGPQEPPEEEEEVDQVSEDPKEEIEAPDDTEAFLKQFEQEDQTDNEREFYQNLEQFEARLKEEEEYLSTSIESRLEDIKTEDGKSIYQLTDKEFNDYLITLQDNEQLELAGRAQYNREQLKPLQKEAKERYQQYLIDKVRLQDYKDQPEWNKVSQEWEDRFPGFKEKFAPQVIAYLEPLLTRLDNNDRLVGTFDEKLYQKTRDQKGKSQAVYNAMKALGLLSSLSPSKDEEKSEESTPQPSATPDVSTRRKKVKKATKPDNTADKGRYYAQMSTKDSMKLSEDEWDEALRASMG